MAAQHDGPRPFDWGAASNDDLTPLILDTAADSGWPYNQALYVLGCTSKSFKASAHRRLSRKISEMATALGKVHATGRVLQDNLRFWASPSSAAQAINAVPPSTLKHTYDASKTAFRILAERFAGDEGDRLACAVFNAYERYRSHPNSPPFRTGEFIFDFNWRLLAHAVQRKCMLCSGVRKVCHCDTAAVNSFWKGSRTHLSISNETWHFRVFQGLELAYCRPVCIQNAVIDPHRVFNRPPEAPVHSGSFENFGSSIQYRQWALARALFHAAGIFRMQASEETAAVFRGTLPLVLLPNAELQGETMAERLQLTPVQISQACDEVSRLMSLRALEYEAARNVRIAKLRQDCDAYLRVQLGETLACIGDALPTALRTLDRALRRFDHDAEAEYNGRYRDASECAYILAFLRRLCALKTVAVPIDKELIGWPSHEVCSVNAYEWLFDLTSGAMPGDDGQWRYELDNNIVDFWERYPIPTRFNLYMISSMRVFDKIGTGFSLTVEVRKDEEARDARDDRPVPRVLYWVIRHSTGWSFAGEVPRRSHYNARMWHDMVTSCFSAELDAEYSELAAQLKARVPPAASWCETAKPNGPQLRKLEEVRAYYEEVAGTLVLFPSTRHSGLFLLGIGAARVAEALATFHDGWSIGNEHVPGNAQCPQDARDFALWICGNPAGREIHWTRARTPPPVPPLPQPDEDVYSPSSPQLSGPSPQYHPTSPVYSPGSPAHSPWHGSDNDNASNDEWDPGDW